MIDKKLPLDEAINAMALQIDGYKELLISRGWKDLNAEIDAYVAGVWDRLKTCDLDKVRALQGQIEAFEWLMGHFEEAGEHLKSLMAQAEANKAEAAE